MSIFIRTINGLFLAGLLCLPAILSGVPSQHQNVIRGAVADSAGNPLFAVDVVLPQLNRGTITDQQGRYQVSHLPSGQYHVQFSRMGYQDVTRQVTLKEQDTLTINVTLHKTNLNLKTITISESAYSTQLLNTPKDVDVLSGQKKEQQQSASLGGTLEKLSGVDNISTGSQMGKPVIRGLSGSRIRVLFDGIPMDYQQFGVRHMPTADPVLAERIEVIRGPSSVLYGSDALGGAINVIPTRIPGGRHQPTFLHGQILNGFHSMNREWMTGLQLQGGTGPWGLTGALVKRAGDNMRVPDIPTARESGDSTAPRFTGELDHTDFDQLNGSLGLGYTGNFGKVLLRYGHWGNEQNILLPDGNGVGQYITNDIIEAKGIIQLGNNNILRPKLSYLRNHRRANPNGQTRDLLPDTRPAYLDLTVENWVTRIEFDHQSIGPFSGQVGIEGLLQHNRTSGRGEPLIPEATITNTGIYFYEEAEWKRFTISVGGRFDTRIQQEQPNGILRLPDTSAGETEAVLSQQYNVFSGSFGLNYRVYKHLSLAANIGRGFRAPNIFELHADGVHGGVAAYQLGNPFLQPEFSLNTDLSVRWSSQYLELKATCYRNTIDNYIYQVNTGQQFQGTGPVILKTVQGNAVLWGGYLSGRVQILPWLQLRGGFQMVKGENKETGKELPLLPAPKTNGEIRYMEGTLGPLEQFYASVSVRHAFEKEAAGRYEPFWQFGSSSKFAFGTASTDPYTLFDLGIGFHIPVYDQYIHFHAGARNVLNTAYRDFLDTYKGYALSPGRDIFVKLKIPLEIARRGEVNH